MRNGRCWVHGGATPSGIASPHYKTGEWTDALPKRLRDRAKQAYSDPDLLSQKKAISILEARYWDVVAQSEQGETGELWQRLYNAAQSHRTANGKDAENTRTRALSTILELIDAGYNEREAWQELREITQEMRLLRDSEQKSIVNKQQSISASEAMVMLGAVLHIVKSNVDDRDALARISREVAALVNKPG